jgi:NAD(P)-dependent dehydrogenase (short-subunit alcohol dehydrogenase family)
MRLDEIPTSELMEVHLVNAIAPALLVGQLKDLLKKSPHKCRFVINVSAAEGRFTQFKMGTHPHTNMVKATMNMMTHTIADDYADDHIYVNSIDPGWVSDQIPRTNNESRQMGSQLLPIDMDDASARLCDLLFKQSDTLHGQLIKDYRIVSW